MSSSKRVNPYKAYCEIRRDFYVVVGIIWVHKYNLTF